MTTGSLGPGAMVMVSAYHGLNKVLRQRARPELQGTGLPTDTPGDVAAKMARHSEIEIALDCVIFTDGGPIGPDEGHRMEELIGSERAKSEMYAALLKLSPEDARAYLSPIADGPAPVGAESADAQAKGYERQRWQSARMLLTRLNVARRRGSSTSSFSRFSSPRRLIPRCIADRGKRPGPPGDATERLPGPRESTSFHGPIGRRYSKG